jgi:hypothetical protein
MRRIGVAASVVVVMFLDEAEELGDLELALSGLGADRLGDWAASIRNRRLRRCFWELD